MKKVIELEDLCCKTCAERIERKLLLAEGVSGARANFKKKIVNVETTLSDEALAVVVRDAGFVPASIRLRKGVFA